MNRPVPILRDTHLFRPALAGLAMLCMILACTACGKNRDKEAENYIKSAREFISQNKPETAVLEYKSAIEADPENDTALFELAETYVVLNKSGSAIRYYNLAAKANPENLSARLRLAQIHFQRDELIAARSELSKVLADSPESVNALHILSGIQIKERDLASAVQTLEKAEAIDPANVKTHTALARLYIKLRRVPDAVAAYEKGMAQDPSDRSAYMGLARLYAGQRKWDRVEFLLMAMIEKGGNLAQKYMDLAEFYQGQKKPGPAEAYFHKAVAESDNPILPTMALARFYTNGEQREKAVQTLETILPKNKNKPLILTGLSQVYLHFGDIDAAEKAVNRALEMDNRFEDALFQQGKVLMARHKYREALALFDQVLAQNRIHAKAYYLRAVCIKEEGAADRPEQALFRAAAGMLDNPKEFEKNLVKENLVAAVTIDPGLTDARFELATLHLLEKRADKANEQIQAILAAGPPDHRLMNLVAGVKLLEGDIKEAEKIYRTIIRENPQFSAPYIRLGLLYRSLDRVEDSIPLLEKAFAMEPARLGLTAQVLDMYQAAGEYDRALEKVNAFSNLAGEGAAAFFLNRKGYILQAKGDEAAAAQAFRQAIDRDPKYLSPHLNMAGLLLNQGRADDALAHLIKAEALDPGSLPVLLALGEVYDIRDDLEKAEAYYQKVLEISPRHAGAANNLAFILAENPNRLEEAFRLANIARNQRPRDPDVMDTLGWVFYQRGSYLNALSELKESLELNPGSALTHFHYGMTLYKTKRFEKARLHLRKALELDPGFRGADLAKKMLY